MTIPHDVNSQVDIAAYYLPQFYPMGINSQYWGEGYTEWNAVVASQRGWRSVPAAQLTPGELGFYDLRSQETRRAQGRLAREHGIAAFAMYHYWSKADRVMPDVVDLALQDGEPDIPFFFCWANHDWTLAWQGHPETVTWAQEYDEAANNKHIDWLLEVFSSERYYRINGKPVISIFSPLSVPEIAKVSQRWRDRATSAGFPGLVILGVAPQLNPSDPKEFGLDAWIQSPGAAVAAIPKWRRAVQSANSPLKILRLIRFRDYTFSGDRIGQAVRRARSHVSTDIVPTVLCTWNNSGRRKRGAWSMETNPSLFEAQLQEAMEDAVSIGGDSHTPGRRMVFINAWNEWGEAMSIEPSVEYGREFLEAVRRQASRFESTQ